MYEVTCPICNQTRNLNNKPKSNVCRSCARKLCIENRTVNYPEKLCKFCNLPFHPNNNKQVYCKRDHHRNCPVCGKDYIEDNIENLKRPPVACSYECRVKRTQQTSLAKYGCKAPGNSESARIKSKQTMMKKYGTEYAMQNEELRTKARKSLINKYGVDNANKYPEFISKRLETNLNRYGNYIGPALKRESKTNQRFGNLLLENNIEFESEFKVENKIFDFKVDNILIEIDPTFTHTCHKVYKYDPLDKFYHRDKTMLAEKHGYRCIHVFDWDDLDKIINLLLPKTRVFARNCKIYRLNKSVADKFLNDYHIQKSCKGQLLYLGLVKDGELYQVMTFGKPRYDRKHDVELLRLCTRPGYTVVGGASKLFSFATSEYGLNNIISYCDRSKFLGTVYEKIGMKLIRTTPPQEIWSKGYEHITANLLRQRGYDQLFRTNYGKGASNESLMLENGWLPIYDCGQYVYEFNQ